MDAIEIALSGGFVVAAVAWYFLYARSRAPHEGVLSDYVRRREADRPDRVVEAADAVAPTGTGGPTIMMTLANPRTESALVTLVGALAKHEGGRLFATHVVTVPDQTVLSAAAENRDRIEASSAELLDAAKADAEAFDVPIETRTILSHRAFDAARTSDADTVLMGYGGARFAGGRAEAALEELTHDLPCDFLVLDGQELDLSDVFVPTVGGGSSDLSAEVARALRGTVGTDVSLLHVVDPGGEEAGREFLHEWAAGHGLSDAEIHVETVIGRVGETYGLVIIGATERGLLWRIVRGSLAFDTIERLQTPVLLTERPFARSPGTAVRPPPTRRPRSEPWIDSN